MREKTRWAIACILMLIAALFFLYVRILNPADNPENRTVRLTIYKTNFWKDTFDSYFKEPFETMLVVFKDGEPWAYTTREDPRININAAEFEYLLAKKGRRIEDIFLIVHDHPTPKRPTPGNKNFLHEMRRRGFEGIALVYYPATRRVREVK